MMVYLVVHHGTTGDTLRFPISPTHNTIQQPHQQDHHNPANVESKSLLQPKHDPIALHQLMEALTSSCVHQKQWCGPYKANFVLMSITTTANNNNSHHDDNVSSNVATVTAAPQETILGVAPLRIFIYPSSTTKLGIVDVDGTITTSTLHGFWNTAILHDYSIRHCHAGICPFLTQYAVVTPTSTSSTTTTTTSNETINKHHQQQRNHIQLIYLTNRPITYVDATRNLLNELREDHYTLPKGPLIGFTGNLAGVFKVCTHVYAYTSYTFTANLSRNLVLLTR
jgi:hypothetical protein